MCRCSTQPNAVCPRVEICTEAVVVFALAWLEKKNNNNNFLFLCYFVVGLSCNNNKKMNIMAFW